MNICVQVFVDIYFHFSWCIFRSRILGLYVDSVYLFEELLNFSKVAAHFAFLLVIYEGSNFFISFTTLVICLFAHNHLSKYEVLSLCGFDLH